MKTSTLAEVSQLEVLETLKSGDRISITYIGHGVPRSKAIDAIVSNVLHSTMDAQGDSTRLHLQQMRRGGLIPRRGDVFTAIVGGRVINPAWVEKCVEGHFEISLVE